MNSKEVKQKLFSPVQVVDKLKIMSDYMAQDRRNHKKYFTEGDIVFLFRLLFDKPGKELFLMVVDHVLTNKLGSGVINSVWMRRLTFFLHLVSNGFNATQAAIQTGYSRRSARRQGCRLIKKSGEICRAESFVDGS